MKPGAAHRPGFFVFAFAKRPNWAGAFPLAQDAADQPHVSERVAYGALQHPIDGARADHRMVVFHNGIKFRRARSDGPSSHRRRIIDEQFDPDRRGSHQVWTPSPMRRRLISQK